MKDDPATSRFAYVKAIRQKYTPQLLQKLHVVGVALDQMRFDDDQQEEWVLVVLVDQHVPPGQLPPEDRIPFSLEGVPVVVRQVEVFEAL